MEFDQLLQTLGYADRPGRFLRAGTAECRQAENFGHIFRHATGKKNCSLKGIYQLASAQGGSPAVPVVYVCEAEDDAAAQRIHRLVWNQDVVPFVMVHTPRGVRLYSGFEYLQGPGPASPDQGLLGPLIAFNDIREQLAALTADAIDSGEVWRQLGATVHPEARVYWRLLRSLQKLDRWLRDNGLPHQQTRHALMGKYVYLHYLEGRDILSAERLQLWKIGHDTIFGRTATLKGLADVSHRLDEFLNGRVFPIKFRGPNAPAEEHVQRVAAAFAGDEFEGDQWQLHLDFQAYDFSYIPIETLSMIYEQFLHMPEQLDSGEEEEATEGRKAGAYYTPIPVVNFMLAEMQQHRPLHRSITVYDPACGSGAFLVQCYRKLIERTYPAGRKRPTPFELKRLLQQHIFGSDRDEDACSVAEFSLVLTLLSYVTPPDLLEYPRFRLPTLRNSNIFHCDFFNDRLRHANCLGKRRFHWIVGNPPWKRLETTDLDERDGLAMKWMEDNVHVRPVGKYSLSQAFTWRCAEFLHPKGQAALLLPAMTLFEDVSQDHRSAFFRQHRVVTIANYSNFARVLFKDRVEVPAAAVFFEQRKHSKVPDPEETTSFFSPLVANQEQTRPEGPGQRNEVWSIVINESEICDVRYAEIASGSGIPWKLAMWGSPLDGELLDRMGRKWKPLEELEAKWKPTSREFAATDPHHLFFVSQGPDLRPSAAEGMTYLEELKNKRVLDVNLLKNWTGVFSFDNFELPTNERFYVRNRGGWKGLPVCRPPHVMMSAARNFAVFTDEYLVVEARQIGVGSVTKDQTILKALALYLNSDFAYYHAFFSAAELGVTRARANLSGFKQLPCPLYSLSRDQLAEWAELQDKLAKTQPRRIDSREEEFHDGQPDLLGGLNRLVAKALGLSEQDEALIHDLVHVRLALNDGQVRPAAMTPPDKNEIEVYARWLHRDLNDFVDGGSDSANDGSRSPNEESRGRYSVSVVFDNQSAFVAVEFTMDLNLPTVVSVLRGDAVAARELQRTRENLRQESAQWVYFNRDLKLYHGPYIYLFKPMERFHWTRTQAMLDAAEIIGDLIARD